METEISQSERSTCMNWKMCSEVLYDMKMPVKLKGRVKQNDGQTMYSSRGRDLAMMEE